MVFNIPSMPCSTQGHLTTSKDAPDRSDRNWQDGEPRERSHASRNCSERQGRTERQRWAIHLSSDYNYEKSNVVLVGMVATLNGNVTNEDLK